jgi:hypothetical protein
MRLDPLAISDMVDDRGIAPAAIIHRGEIPTPIKIGLKPWPEKDPEQWGKGAPIPVPTSPDLSLAPNYAMPPLPVVRPPEFTDRFAGLR